MGKKAVVTFYLSMEKQRLGDVDCYVWILSKSPHPILVPLCPIWQVNPCPMPHFC